MYVAHFRLTKHNKIENKIGYEEDSASDSSDFIRNGNYVSFSWSSSIPSWEGFMAIGAHRASGVDPQLGE